MELGPLDHFFAQRLLKEQGSEDTAHFLAHLMRSSREGHLCLRCSSVPHLPDSIVQEGIDLQPKTWVVKDEDRYYLKKNWIYETYLLQQVQRLRSVPFPKYHEEEKFLMLLDQSHLLEEQKKALRVAFFSSFSILCGGPGTGKTYTASNFVKVLLATKTKERYRVILAAPTGKAASHLHSALQGFEKNVESTTIHSLLKIKPGQNKIFSKRKIDADLVIVDEASMLDIFMLAALLEAIGSDTRLLLIGDPNQLPPVEAPSLFREIADLFAVHLVQSMRTDEVALQSLAHQINMGMEDFAAGHLLNWSFDSSLSKRLFSILNPPMIWEEPDPMQCLQEFNRLRVLGALRKGPYGIDQINQQILDEISHKLIPGQWWVIPIMITASAPDMHLYNGNCGVLIGKSSKGLDLKEANAYFPQKVPFKKLPPHEVAFCLSIHKSQGSEFEEVIAMFPQGSENFGKEALYTAVTRAKKRINLIAEPGVLKKMVQERSSRQSGFKERFEKLRTAG